MKMNKLSKRVLLVFLFLGAFLLVVIFLKISGPKKVIDKGQEPQIIVRDEDTQVTFNKNGRIEVKTPEKVFYQQWDREKINQLFSYLEEKAKTEKSQKEISGSEDEYSLSYFSQGKEWIFNISKDDEIIGGLLEEIFNLAKDGESISHYFSPSPSYSPAPSSTPGSSPGSSPVASSVASVRPSPPSSPSPSPQGRPQDCPFWVLSMCIWPRQPSPSPSPQPSQGPGQVIIPDCTLWEHLVTNRAVISQTVCVKEE